MPLRLFSGVAIFGDVYFRGPAFPPRLVRGGAGDFGVIYFSGPCLLSRQCPGGRGVPRRVMLFGALPPPLGLSEGGAGSPEESSERGFHAGDLQRLFFSGGFFLSLACARGRRGLPGGFNSLWTTHLQKGHLLSSRKITFPWWRTVTV
jgi:hypothetical protein